MKYTIIIEADQNDADYISETNSVNLDGFVFDGWGEYEKLKVTYLELFTAFGKALKIADGSSNWRHNWDENSQTDTLLETIKQLGLEDSILTPSVVDEALIDFVPGGGEYPVHTILNITAVPAEGTIAFY